jgi:hypothetical protein
VADGSGGTLVRQWTLSYAYSAVTNRSLLQSLTDCDGSGNCLPATSFTWTAHDPANYTYSAPGSGNWGGGQGIVFQNTTTTNTTSVQIGRMALPGDYNGDGVTDLTFNFSATALSWTLNPSPTAKNAISFGLKITGGVDVTTP